MAFAKRRFASVKAQAVVMRTGVAPLEYQDLSVALREGIVSL